MLFLFQTLYLKNPQKMISFHKNKHHNFFQQQ